MENKQKGPQHIAIIMDGNGRWAKQRGLERAAGHFEGAQRVMDLMEHLKRLDVHYLTLYAFSTENWKRSKEEVDYLMDLMVKFLDENGYKMKQNKARLLVTGQIDGLPDKCVKKLKEIMTETAKDYEYTLILALNYGGRTEITDAVKKIVQKVQNKELDPADITESTISENLYLPDVPDPDLMIRTSGEIRLSNFLLWELSYAEFYFTDVLWPDFTGVELEKAVEVFKNRNRRFGGRP